MKKIIIKEFGYCELFTTLFCHKCSPKKKEIICLDDPHDFETPHFLSIINSLLNTFYITKDNLPEECFAHSVFETPLSSEYFKEMKSRKSQEIKTIEEEIISLQKTMKKILESQEHDRSSKQNHEILIENFGIFL